MAVAAAAWQETRPPNSKNWPAVHETARLVERFKRRHLKSGEVEWAMPKQRTSEELGPRSRSHKGQAMANAPDTSLTPHCADLGTLCHSQLIQALLINLLTTHPELCPRFAEFQSAVSAAALAERSVPASSDEEFIQQLAALIGANQLSSQVIGNHADLWRHGVQGSSRDIRNPQELLVALTEFFNICFPRTFEEWLELSVKARKSAETWQVISEITERVLQGMQSSIEAGVVAVDLRYLQRQCPELAFVFCMMILSDFLGLNTIARPTLGEVITFARSCGLSFSEDDDQQRMQLTSMLLFHPIYQGKRESRVRRENPFAFVVRSELASPPDTIPLLPEIDVEGHVIALRVSEAERCRSEKPDGHPPEQLGVAHAAAAKAGIIVVGALQSPEPDEPKPQRMSRAAPATPERLKIVREAIAVLRKKTPGTQLAIKAIVKEAHMSTGTVQNCLDVLRENGEYEGPKRARGSDRARMQDL